MSIGTTILVAFYLVLPAYFANMAPVIFAKLGWFKFLAAPIDRGKKIGGDYIFGTGKTWRGVVAAVILGIIVAAIQAGLYYYETFKSISLLNYSTKFIIFGVLAGLGAILGDLLKSFIKRRVGIKSGKSWPIFDQVDFIVGFFLFTYWLVYPDLKIILTVFLLTLILHPLTNLSAYFLKIKKVWW